MRRKFAGMLTESSFGCVGCDLGSSGGRPNRCNRFLSSGYLSSNIFLIGERPRDGLDSNGLFDLNLVEEFDVLAGPKYPMVRAIQLSDIDPSDIYRTVAIKCESQRDVKVRHILSCLSHHLGYELEEIKPRVIWTTGWHGTNMVKRHFRSSNLPVLQAGQFIAFDSPLPWMAGKILWVRSPHPSQVRTGMASFESLCLIAETVAAFIDGG